LLLLRRDDNPSEPNRHISPNSNTVRSIRSYREVANPAAEDIVSQVTVQAERLRERLAAVGRVLVVASGKGGVGKSALTANLACALAGLGRRVGAVDADLNGPSLARMLGAHGQQLRLEADSLVPGRGAGDVALISSDLLLPPDAPLRWRNPAAPERSAGGAPAFLFQSMYEGTALREFLADVAWGALDYLLIDAPPGTDKLDRILQLLPEPPVLMLVGTPSAAARAVVQRSASVARELAPSAGLVVNMAAHVCENCGHEQPLFDPVDAEALARETGLPLWAEIPFDRRLAACTDRGTPAVLDLPESPAAKAITKLAERINHEFSA
jgi:ATP-binding protein involved in chromosome partitioning